jgi:eukaryotic-like serine/threonine-protein kinase
MTDFGSYRILERLRTQGGYVTVYRAETADGVPCLLRVLNGEVDPRGDEFQRFQQEFRTLQDLFHPGILPVLDSGQVDGQAYYAAPMAGFRSLQEELEERGTFDWRLAVEIALQVLEAVEHMHASRVLHRDLRTSSIFWDPQERKAVVAEFNLVRNFNEPSLTLQGVKPVAMPLIVPESIREIDFTEETDLYLMGNLIYELVSGESAIRLDFTYRPLSGRIDGVPRRLDEILGLCLAEEPTDRYREAQALRKDLQVLHRMIRAGG